MALLRCSIVVFCIISFLHLTLAQKSDTGDNFDDPGEAMTSSDRASLPVDDEAKLAASGEIDGEMDDEQLKEALLDYGIVANEMPELQENDYGSKNVDLTSNEVKILEENYEIFFNAYDDDYAYGDNYDDYFATTRKPTTTSSTTVSTTTTTPTTTTTTLLPSKTPKEATTTTIKTTSTTPLLDIVHKTEEPPATTISEPSGDDELHAITAKNDKQKSTEAEVIVVPELLDITSPATTTSKNKVFSATTSSKTPTTTKTTTVRSEPTVLVIVEDNVEEESTTVESIPGGSDKAVDSASTVQTKMQTDKTTTVKVMSENVETTTEKKIYFDVFDENGSPVTEEQEVEKTTAAMKPETKPLKIETTRPKKIQTQESEKEQSESTTKKSTTAVVKPKVVVVDAKTTNSADDFDVDDNSDATSESDLQKIPAAAGMSKPMLIGIIVAIVLVLIILILICLISRKRKSGKYIFKEGQPQGDSRADEQLVENGHNSKTNGHNGPVPVKYEADV